MIVDFYHLSASPLERVLPSICEKLLAGDERLQIVADAAQIEPLDAMLWSYARDAFLPHGRAGEAAAAAQPVLLSADIAAENGALNVALTDGRWRDAALGFIRAFYFFDGAHLDEARAAWRSLSGRDAVDCRFWKQDEGGRWVQGP